MTSRSEHYRHLCDTWYENMSPLAPGIVAARVDIGTLLDKVTGAPPKCGQSSRDSHMLDSGVLLLTSSAHALQ